MTDYPFSQPNARRGAVGSISVNGEPAKENLLQQLAKQCVRDSYKYFPKMESEESSSTGRLLHMAIGMSTEANEFLEIVKKIDRGSIAYDNEGVKSALEKEAVDALIYVMNVFGEMGVDPLAAYIKKRDFNNGRFTKGS